jgi:phytoene dehydrogenase-like protein
VTAVSGRGPFDCIVVGAGMAGLTFAALAAQSGKKVLVVEQHYLPGGLFTSFKKRSFLFNVGLEWTTGCGAGEPFHELLRGLGLAEEYPFRRLSVFKTIASPELRAPLDLHCSTDGLRHALRSAFPHQGLAIDRFLDDCMALSSDPRRARAVLVRTGVKATEAMLADYFDDPLLVHLLFSLIGYPSARGVLLMYIVGAMCLGGLYAPAHWDHRRLALLLHRRLLSWGGQARYRTTVSRVLVRGGEVQGVQLAGGEELHAPLVVASVDAHQLYGQLLQGEHSGSRRAQELLGRRPSLSTFCLFLGLRGTLPAASAQHAAYSVLADTAAWQADPASLATIPLRVENQSAVHPQLAPPGKSSLCVWAALPMAAFDHWGQGRDRECGEIDQPRYRLARLEATEVVLGRLAGAFPGLRDAIELIETATPFTFKRYTRNRAGSVSGSSLAEMSYLKPGNFATAVPGLYHIGQWVVQGGVGSVMHSAEALFQTLSLD